MNYVVKDVKKLEIFYNSLVKKMERIGNKSSKTYDEIIRLQELCDMVDVLEPFFQKSVIKRR